MYSKNLYLENKINNIFIVKIVFILFKRSKDFDLQDYDIRDFVYGILFSEILFFQDFVLQDFDHTIFCNRDFVVRDLIKKIAGFCTLRDFVIRDFVRFPYLDHSLYFRVLQSIKNDHRCENNNMLSLIIKTTCSK